MIAVVMHLHPVQKAARKDIIGGNNVLVTKQVTTRRRRRFFAVSSVAGPAVVRRRRCRVRPPVISVVGNVVRVTVHPLSRRTPEGRGTR